MLVVIYTRAVTQHQPWPTVIGGSCHKYHFCRDKSICRDKHNIKYTFVATKLCLSRQVLSRPTYFCRDQHTFVVTNILLSRQKTCFVVFVATNMILVAAPANDSGHQWTTPCRGVGRLARRRRRSMPAAW